MKENKNIPDPTLPMYIKKIYPKYLSKKKSEFLDSIKIQNFLSLGNRNKLVQSVLREIEQNADYLQIGATFGDQIDQVADKVGYYGNFHIVDVSKVQTERIKEKYKGIQQNINFSNQNGLAKITYDYDGIICFFLLHELPPLTRRKMVNHLLNSVKEKSKVVFIDYHKPNNRLIQKISKIYNRLYNPFMEEFINEEIFDLADYKDEFYWNKHTICNGRYQKVVATRKSTPLM